MIMYALLLFVILKYATFLDFKSGEELLDVTAILEVFYTVTMSVTLLKWFFHAPQTQNNQL
jgi:hypothetical protein